MKLVNFIKENQISIVDSWVNFARTMQPWAKDLSLKELQDHAEELLSAVVEDMESPQSKNEQSEKSQGYSAQGKLGLVGQSHASGRLDTGLSLVQLASEFRALRASILSKWEEAQGIESGEVTRFNEAIDESLVSSISRYSETVSNTREEFLAILSHELRNPIGAITMGAMLLKDPLNAKSQGIVDVIINSSKRMNRMVNDLLDLARTRLGPGIPITPKAMDLAPLCEQMIPELQAAHPDHSLEYKSIGNLHGEWDGDRITQVILNLATNALQYGSTVRPVSIVAREKGQDVVIEVHNDGKPIPESAQRTIFSPMTRHQSDDGAKDKNTHGLGLGLHIANEIVKSHGGAISLASTQDQGTTFTVTLPRRPPSKYMQVVQQDIFS